LYQIAEKFEQRNAPPSTIIDELVNDDDYYFYNKKHRSSPDSGSTGRGGSNQHRKLNEDGETGKRWNRKAFKASKGLDKEKEVKQREVKQREEEGSRRLSWFGWGSSKKRATGSKEESGLTPTSVTQRSVPLCSLVSL